MTSHTATKPELEQAFRSFVAGIKQHDEKAISALLTPDLNHNGQQVGKQEYIGDLLKATADTQDIVVDMLIVSSQNPAVAARLIHHSGQGHQQHPEYVFVHFSQSNPSPQITSIRSLADEASSSPIPLSPPAPTPEDTTTAVKDLPSFYTDYIASINTHTMEEHFPRFCQPNLTHNTRALDIPSYIHLIESSFEDIRGLHFNVVDLVADEAKQQVASRIEFTGRPVRPFRGVEPGENGEEVKFHEHAFYFLEGGRIVRVWSVLDMDAYKRCLGRS
ncbi:unnamed protein product [Clonostachys rosea f. rosea IK726]|uniref:Uncharacterized protein n=1 Tax=Clonostachys rosea f. rosea IK726 TaxID=1349383 RepID=A0ACA9TCJ2_BIOOC|nr:unnamed protein product [Clonostachys rosea f. rosea IK726]